MLCRSRFADLPAGRDFPVPPLKEDLRPCGRRNRTGGRHVLGRITSEVGKMPREVWPIVAAHWSRPGFYAGMRSHIASIPDTVMEMQDADPIREIPVPVLTPGEIEAAVAGVPCPHRR